MASPKEVRANVYLQKALGGEIDVEESLHTMRVFITGAKGQLGRALQAQYVRSAVLPADLPECDITDRACVMQAVTEFKPDVVIHSAAMTDVDGCARDPDAAYRVNALGTQNVALACQATGCVMLYISTNEVFDGKKTEPYLEFDTTNPINAYGRSKLAGERVVRDLLARFYIVRIAWLYGKGGNHFVRKVIRRADEQSHLRYVTDEIGSPTYAEDVASGVRQLVQTNVFGIYHFVNSGVASRLDFVNEILRLSGRSHVQVEPITLADFPRPSTPPPYTPLRNFCGAVLGITFRPWQEALAEYLSSNDC
jgi:dTDP-4-dehydrorhamnose reductase